ncbi:MAG: toxin [Desulfobulbaceae bacterium]|nr:toxin [Desulfobulbaceae bacterium]
MEFESFEQALQLCMTMEEGSPEQQERIIAVIDRLLDNPEDADGVMKGEHRGRFKKYVGRKDYRLIYYYCELCRKPNEKLTIACEHCERIAKASVIFFEVYHKNDKNKLKRSGF